MLDLHVPALTPAGGEWLALEEYSRDFDLHYDQVRDRDCWKLERKQFFKESNSRSWDAFRQGDLAEARRLLKDRAPALREAAEEAAARGSVFRRVRVVEQPLTAYVQWELRSLRVRSENGGPVRVVRAEDVGRLERDSPLPELVALGGRVLYQVVYTEGRTRSSALGIHRPCSISRTPGTRRAVRKRPPATPNGCWPSTRPGTTVSEPLGSTPSR